MKIYPVILSGGSGTRMWPLSRSHYPKQFLPLVSDKSLFQDTLNRLLWHDGMADPVVICNIDHRFMVAEQLHELGFSSSEIILEPFGRNTAPAVALAALNLPEADDILLVFPADHVIQNHESLSTTIAEAVNIAKDGKLATFGIVPTSLETGYGYIKKGERVDETQAFSVDTFVEKPDLLTAETYISSGDYYWNSGMFAFRADVYLEELKHHQPEIFSCCQKAVNRANKDADFNRINPDAFEKCPSDSIDYAVMENTSQAVVIPLDAGWNDVGSWSSLWEVSERDDDGNRLHGDVMTYNTKNSLLHSESRLVAAIGLENIVLIETDDAVMVAAKDQVQDVKKIVERLKAEKRNEIEAHRKVYRPWGWYDSIDIGPRHQAKRISVNPGSKISLQKHHHRAEHWVVIKGTAQITIDDKCFLLTEDQSTYIPIGSKHRLENVGKIPLEIIEVQTGSYLGEDDIERFSDDYGRHDGQE